MAELDFTGILTPHTLAESDAIRRKCSEAKTLFKTEYPRLAAQIAALAEKYTINASFAERWAEQIAALPNNDDTGLVRTLGMIRRSLADLFFAAASLVRDGTATAEQIDFVYDMGILVFVLEFDRANALHVMCIDRTKPDIKGIHWYSEQNAKSTDLGKFLAETDYKGFPPYNKKYGTLYDIFEKKFSPEQLARFEAAATPVICTSILNNEQLALAVKYNLV